MGARKLLLLAGAFIGGIALASLPLAAAANPGQWYGETSGSDAGSHFSATNQGDRVDLRGSTSGGGASASSERESNAGSSSGSGAGNRGAGRSGTGGGASAAPPPCGTAENPELSYGPMYCPDPGPPPEAVDTPGPAPEQVQLGAEDVASLAPSNGVLRTEPGGWALAGLPFNPSAQSEPQNVTGELLGLPVEVRFTPVAFHWDYGDGTTRTSSTGGGTWQQLGQSEFTATATSRTYAQRGVYQLTLRLEQTAEYRVLPDGGWQAVPGTILTEVASESIEVGAAGTVLVDRSCNRDARGPGC